MQLRVAGVGQVPGHPPGSGVPVAAGPPREADAVRALAGGGAARRQDGADGVAHDAPGGLREAGRNGVKV